MPFSPPLIILLGRYFDLPYTKRKVFLPPFAGATRLELATLGSTSQCSGQLSYAPRYFSKIIFFLSKNNLLFLPNPLYMYW